MTFYHTIMTRAKALLFTLLLIGGLCALPGQALARVGKGASVTVGASATALQDESVPQTAARRILVCVPEDASGPVYVGGEGVTVAGGMPVGPGSCYAARLAPREILFGISEGSVAVKVQESSNL